MESKIVSEVLAEALITLPKITAEELYERCGDKVSEISLAQFRQELSKYLTDGTITGYESRKGRYGGIYKVGSAMVTGNKVEGVVIDAELVRGLISKALETESRITAGEVFGLFENCPIGEIQFKAQLSKWLNDGTFAEFESSRGKNGGISLRSAGSEWVAVVDSEETEVVGLNIQVSSNIKIVQSDERNWVVQKLSGNTWVNKAYHPDLAGCLKSVVKHTINGEFNLVNSVVQLKDLYSMFLDMESRITNALEKSVSAVV